MVPFPADGALDVVARALAEQMRTDLGQAVIVDNRAGAGGTVGSAAVARAEADGHTILLGSVATHAIAAGLYPKLPYNPLTDFVPITQLTSSPLDYQPPPDAARKYVRGAVDPNTTATKAKKRLTFVAAYPPDHPRDPAANLQVPAVDASVRSSGS